MENDDYVNGIAVAGSWLTNEMDYPGAILTELELFINGRITIKENIDIQCLTNQMEIF